MISSSDQTVTCGLDTMLIVYALLDGHPASQVCEDLIRSQKTWFANTLVLMEVRAVLSKIYGVPSADINVKLAKLVAGPVVFFDVDPALVLASFGIADTANLDLTDASLLETAKAHGARTLATEDATLAKACSQFGIEPISPITDVLRRDIADWERMNLQPKGLPRVLGSIRFWLTSVDSNVANLFWSKTGSGSHLP